MHARRLFAGLCYLAGAVAGLVGGLYHLPALPALALGTAAATAIGAIVCALRAMTKERAMLTPEDFYQLRVTDRATLTAALTRYSAGDVQALAAAVSTWIKTKDGITYDPPALIRSWHRDGLISADQAGLMTRAYGEG